MFMRPLPYFLLLAAACASDQLTPGSGLTEVLDGVEKPDILEPDTDVDEAEPPCDIYDQERLPTFELTLEPEAEARLREKGREEYVPATLELIDGEIREKRTVGVRLKGKGSFRKLDAKSGFRIKIDKYVDDQRLCGLKDLTLNNMIQDRSVMAERLAYTVFREMGSPAPRANHARVSVNGVYFGLYANIETPNKDFLRRWFEDPDRNLYEQKVRDFNHAKAAETFELETNEDSDDDRALLRGLQDATRASDLGRVRELMDWPSFLLYSALEASVNQVDGYSFAQNFPNNYRIYDSARGGVLIPWGMDWALGHVWTQDDGYYLDPFWVRPSHGVLLRMCLEDEACTREYAEVVRKVAESWDALKLEERMDRWSEQVDEAWHEDMRREITIEEALPFREVRREIIRGRSQALLDALDQQALE
jgi:hypothetical protein